MFDTYLPLIPSSLDEMGVHPSEEGYNKMAKTWFEGIDSLPSGWIQPARAPLSEAPLSWQQQQRTACDALKGTPRAASRWRIKTDMNAGWQRDTYVTDEAYGKTFYPPLMDMSNWTSIHGF